jgi:hypothetical protein
MGDDTSPLDSRQEVDNDGAKDDGHTTDGGAVLPELGAADVVGEEAANVERESAADQQI